MLVRVFDQQGLPANASVTFRPVNRFDTWSFTSTKNGECEFECLEAATYIVCASTNQGLFAHSGRLVIDAGKVMGPVDLRLALGAKLRVQYDGDQSARTYRVIVEGTTCARDKIARGTTRTFIVPCGEIELQAEAEQLAPATSERFVVYPGEERYVTVR
ncbi:MAG: hypothetical protein IPK60_20550 [Sandaracinaceae bacterium]|nr:hypothetical protein [Sandaracinaceae bacterium]